MSKFMVVLGSTLLLTACHHTSVVPKPAEELEPLNPVEMPCMDCGEEDIRNEVNMTKRL